jgi:hypothetical protein
MDTPKLALFMSMMMVRVLYLALTIKSRGYLLMGMRCLSKNCCIDFGPNQPAPDPKRYEIIDVEYFRNATLAKVRYLDCTNYEGVKILVFMGKRGMEGPIDPHFSEDDQSPIARFKPNHVGLRIARAMCSAMDEL